MRKQVMIAAALVAALATPLAAFAQNIVAPLTSEDMGAVEGVFGQRIQAADKAKAGAAQQQQARPGAQIRQEAKSLRDGTVQQRVDFGKQVSAGRRKADPGAVSESGGSGRANLLEGGAGNAVANGKGGGKGKKK